MRQSHRSSQDPALERWLDEDQEKWFTGHHDVSRYDLDEEE